MLGNRLASASTRPFQLSGSCPAAVRQLSGSCPAAVRQLSGSCPVAAYLPKMEELVERKEVVIRGDMHGFALDLAYGQAS